MTKRLSYGGTALVFGLIAFPLLGLITWLQEALSLPNWGWVILGFLSIGFAAEVQYRIGPEGSFSPFLVPSSFSSKDKAVYWISITTFIITLAVVVKFWDEFRFSSIMKLISFAVTYVFLIHIPIRVFGSQELIQLLSRRIK